MSKTSNKRLSSSMAVTSAPLCANPCVNVPMPGPTSSTGSPGVNSAACTISSTMPRLIRKFCPNFLLILISKRLHI